METIKSDRYTQNDLQVYLKRRVKNMGLLSDTISQPVGTSFIAFSMNDNFIYTHTNGIAFTLNRLTKSFVIDKTIDVSNLKPDGNPWNLILRQTNTFYDEFCFCSGNMVLGGATRSAVFLAHSSGGATLIDTITEGSADNQFNISQQLDTKSNGQLYICDSGNNRVKIYDYGVYSAKVTTPSGSIYLTSDELGNVYTVENSTADKKIYKYNKDLGAVGNWIVDTVASSNLSGIASDEINNKIYVISGETNSVKSYNRDGSGVATLISTSNALNIATNGINIILTNNDTDIRIYTVAGALIKTITKTGATFSTVKIYNNIIYALNGNSIITYNIDGTNETTLISGVAGFIAGFCVDTKGLVYLTEVGNDVILKYNSDGEYVSTFGSAGAGDGQLNNAQQLTYNTFNAQIVCADYGNTRLQTFRYGKFIKKLEKSGGGAGTGNGEFTNPTGICFDKNNNLYVKDNTRIQKFNKEDNFISVTSIANIGKSIQYSQTENSIYQIGYRYALKYNINNFTVTVFNYLNLNATGYDYGVSYIDNNFFYILASVGGNLYLYRYEITPDYDDEWINITQDIINKDLELKYTTEESNFSLGKVDIGDFNIELLNVNDKYDFETNPDSIFYSATGIYQRNNSLIKIELKGTELSRMLVDGKNITNKELTISFKLYNPFKYFETISSDSITQNLTDGDKISDVIPYIANNRFFENIIEYNASDIDIYYDAVINDVSALPDNCFDLLKALSQMGKFKFGIYAGRKFYANNIIDKMALRTTDYLITENNLLEVSSYNNGEHRLFKNVEIKYTTGVATYTIPEEVQLCFNEDRTVSFDLACITSNVIAQQVADDFANFSSWASKEIEIKIPILNYDNNLFDKVYAFNIFDSTRGFKFNTPSLLNGNTVLPTKESATQNNRLLYYPLSVRHKVGREFTTILKLKEFIGEAL